jgi:hypothetical protein
MAGQAAGSALFFFIFIFMYIRIHPSIEQRPKRSARLKKGSLNHYTDKHTAPKDCHRPSLSSECCPGGEREMGCIIILIPPDHEILSPPTTKEGPGKKRYHDLQLCNSDEQIIQRHL